MQAGKTTTTSHLYEKPDQARRPLLHKQKIYEYIQEIFINKTKIFWFAERQIRAKRAFISMIRVGQLFDRWADFSNLQWAD